MNLFSTPQINDFDAVVAEGGDKKSLTRQVNRKVVNSSLDGEGYFFFHDLRRSPLYRDESQQQCQGDEITAFGKHCGSPRYWRGTFGRRENTAENGARDRN